MIKKIAFVMYPVTDMARARRFYEGDLGLVVTTNHGDRWVEYDPPGGCLALATMAQGVNPSAVAGGSIAFEVEDVHALTARLKASGTVIKVEPFETPVCHISVIIDPEGNAVTLHQLKPKTA
jgi:predicted enzyme related to lactoylglutathione lyase